MDKSKMVFDALDRVMQDILDLAVLRSKRKRVTSLRKDQPCGWRPLSIVKLTRSLVTRHSTMASGYSRGWLAPATRCLSHLGQAVLVVRALPSRLLKIVRYCYTKTVSYTHLLLVSSLTTALLPSPGRLTPFTALRGSCNTVYISALTSLLTSS